MWKQTLLLVVPMALVGCGTPSPRPTTDTTDVQPPPVSEPMGMQEKEAGESLPAAPAAPADERHVDRDTKHRLVWQLPAAAKLRYVCEGTIEAGGPMSVTGGVSFTIDITAPANGIALVDTALRDVTLEMNGQAMPRSTMAQSFEVRTLLDAAEGFDPHRAMPQQQLNMLEMIFPLPREEVSVGSEWPMKVQMLALGRGAQGTENNVAVLQGIAVEEGRKLARMDLRSKATAKMGSDVNMALGMSVSGSAVFDVTRGRFSSIDLVASMSLPGPPPMGKKMKMKTAIKTTLESSVILGPEDVEKYTRRLEVRRAVNRSVELARSREWDEALSALSKVIDSDVRGEHAALIAAQIYGAQQKWERAVEAIEKELQRHPKSLQALGLAQALYRRAGKPEKATEVGKKLRAAMGGAPVPRPGR